MKFKLIEGYKGSNDALIAVERGEIDGMCATVEGIEDVRGGWVAEGKLRVLFNMERKAVPELKAPSIFEFARTEEQRQILASMARPWNSDFRWWPRPACRWNG